MHDAHNKEDNMKTYNIGIDLTYGTHLEIEAKNVEEATKIAKQMILFGASAADL